MRQVFSSPRLENVERVAQLLRDAGIQARITHGRSYRGGLRGNFSYRDHTRTDPVPAVWVVESEDQPRARTLLRNEGLLDSTREETGYRLPAFRTEAPVPPEDPGRKRAFRLKAGLLLVIAVVLVLAFFSQYRGAPAPAAGPARAPIAALPAGMSSTPDALAVAVLAGELPRTADAAICLSVDGTDPAPGLLAMLDTPGRVIPLSRCPAGDLPRLAISAYRAAPTGAGSITLERSASAGATPVAETYEVSRGAKGWRVIEMM
jgi:hypothetical protein